MSTAVLDENPPASAPVSENPWAELVQAATEKQSLGDYGVEKLRELIPASLVLTEKFKIAHPRRLTPSPPSQSIMRSMLAQAQHGTPDLPYIKNCKLIDVWTLANRQSMAFVAGRHSLESAQSLFQDPEYYDEYVAIRAHIFSIYLNYLYMVELWA